MGWNFSYVKSPFPVRLAPMVKQLDTNDSGSFAERRRGGNPLGSTNFRLDFKKRMFILVI